MPIAVQCSGCSAKFNAPDKLAGQQANCPKCGNLLLIGLERVREKSAAAASMSPALAEKKPLPPPPKPAASSQPAERTKPPLIGPGMQRVLVILGVVAAILVLLSQVIAPLLDGLRHDPQPEQQTAAVPSEAELAAAQERERKAAKPKVKKPVPKKPWDPLEPEPTEVDPIGGKLVDVAFVLPPDVVVPQDSFPKYNHEKFMSELHKNPLESKNLELDWDGHRLGMTLESFKLKHQYPIPAKGLPFAKLLTSDTRTPEERRREPRAELHEQPWHVDANIVMARVVMVQDDPALDKYLPNQEDGPAKERLYCFIDNKLCFVRHVFCTLEEDKVRAGHKHARLPSQALDLFRKHAYRGASYAAELHSGSVFVYRDELYEHLEVTKCYGGERNMLIARDIKLCQELNRRRLAAEKLANGQ